MTPIRAATGQAGKAILAGVNPAYIAITPDGKTACVSNAREAMGLSDTVTPMDLATGTPGKVITVGDNPGPIAITPYGRTVYVADFFSGTVTRIRTATDKRLMHVKVGSGPD